MPTASERPETIVPASTTDSKLMQEEQAQARATDGCLVVGIKHIDDIVADLGRALAGA
ncbi:MAG TPA: hypothetical protein VLV50_18350 [Stellaceae bacterium]|nr:hypothetical protein [Stellaceae bacterium]